MVEEEIDEGFRVKDNHYTIEVDKDRYILRRFYIKKDGKLLYAFIGGMWYSKDVFSLKQKISLPYPFSTYYTFKILDEKRDDELCRSLLYVKMPIIVLQFEDRCLSVEFDPVIKAGEKEVFPFISLSEDGEHYIITFYLFRDFEVKEKESAWLGIGKKRIESVEIKAGDTFTFSTVAKEYRKWGDAVRKIAERDIKEVEIEDAEKVFEKGKQALWRSYDHLAGTFLQLPWRESTGFTFVNSSYSLLTYDAVRLHYFTRWYKVSRDEDFREWSKKLSKLFVNPNLYKINLKQGRGIIWYNMTNLTKNGLQGYFYMDCGYSGYPGGQASIAFHLLQYLKYERDEKVEELVKKSLEYILSTQKENGSWPMAIHQEGKIRFRPEKLDRYETSGGTAESIRALISGYKQFKDERLKKAALKALKYLEDSYPICYNGLRDIGINEAEAFSAISSIDAFLDAYELTGNERFLEDSLNYAYYTLTWFYMYNTKNLKLKYNFHPISYSITPRLSPYESVWVVSTYMRLYEITKEDIWKRLSEHVYNEAVKWQSKNGGLSEGVFPRGLDKLKSLPMEQTFATVELMQASTRFFHLKQNETLESEELKDRQGDRDIEIERKGDSIYIYYRSENVSIFNVRQWKITFIKNSNLNKYGISLSFSNPYSIKSRIANKIKQSLRGKYGKFILGLADAPFFIKGVYNPNRRNRKIDIHPFEDIHRKNISIEIDHRKAKCICETRFHRISTEINVGWKDGNLHVLFKPIEIEVLSHDLNCIQVLFPIVGCKLLKRIGNQLFFNNFSIKGNFPRVIETDFYTAVDQTLTTNWTHGGLYKDTIDITIFNP